MEKYQYYYEEIELTEKDYLIAESNGIKRATFRNRVKEYGYTKEYAMTVAPSKDPEYTYWRKVGESKGISRELFHHRVRKSGYTYENAATMKPRGIDSEYVYWRDIAARNGIKKELFSQRLRKSGYTYEEAATTPVGEKIERKSKFLITASV